MKSDKKLLQRRHLEVVVAIAEEKSVHRAAAALGMPQPAVSRLLGEAELIVGARLFERSSHGSIATKASADMLAHARFVLRNLERLDDLMLQGRADIKLGCIPRAMHTLMPRLVEQIYPNHAVDADAIASPLEYKVHVQEATSVELLQSLAAGDLDFAILRPAHANLSAALAVERLYDERLVVICAKNSVVADTRVTLDRLASQPWVLPTTQTTSRIIFDQLWDRLGLALLQPVIEARSFEASLALVAGTCLLSIAPESIACRHVAFGAIRIVDVHPCLPSSQVMLAFNRSIKEDVVLNGFRLLVHTAAAALFPTA